MEINFNCTKCGACCRLIPDTALTQYGLPRAESGGCGHILDDNSCAIYDSRPDVCNVRIMWDKHHKHSFTWEEYSKISEELCKILEEMDSIK